MQGRPLARSITSIPAARPHPPNKKLPGVETPGVTGSRHLQGSSVDSSPRKVRASIGGKVAVLRTAARKTGRAPRRDSAREPPRVNDTPPRHDEPMTAQLILLNDQKADWRIDDRTKEIGRKGIAD